MLRQTLYIATLASMLIGPAQANSADTIQVKYLGTSISHKIVEVAVARCAEIGYKVAAAVVNRDGTLAAFLRHPLSGPHTEEVSQRKAYSSATFQTSTHQMSDREGVRFASKILLVRGGIPIDIAGHFYGAVAVSGAESEQDEKCAQAGIEAVAEILEFAD